MNVLPSHAPGGNYLTDGLTLRSWLLTTDHKRIGLLYMGTILLFFLLGGAAAALIRFNLLSPAGLLGSRAAYDRLFTMHGIIMVWFFLVPAAPAVLGNFVLPLMVGARDLAFPRLNLASWYLFLAGGACVLTAFFRGGLDTGWTFYAPFSTGYAHGMVALAALGIILAGYSSIAGGLNFIITIHRLRAPGLTWYRLPIFCWSLYATSMLNVLATPVLTMVLMMMATERIWGVGFFGPVMGGDPLLFQHLFWFYSHPAVYIMIMPGFGIVSEVIPAFASRPLFGYKFVAWASIAIGVISFFVWGHHMFVAGVSTFSNTVFSLLSYGVAVPSAIKVFNWIGTLERGYVRLDAPMLYALGFVGLFTTGGLSGLFLAGLGADVYLHDTYFVIAHFHFIMVGGMVTAFFAGLHFWWPKMTGRLYSAFWSRCAAILLFAGFNVTFMPQYILGYLGMPRRYASYDPQFTALNVLSTGGALILAAAYVLPLVYLGASLLRGARAPANPWGATGLEWQAASPPPTENFAVIPVVTGPPYAYPRREEDMPP
ncbi:MULTISPECIES: cbb3-type cytochrome c oxidase subunit I [Nguyenibacter]|uniref:Cbb3-type cytochrome c oxidase subunit I n=1 Tax=Nguyenibacter vanlangensis TaxID=1216886 RepID=A0A7Y7IX53_9PROT|nr:MULTISPECIES: cbb3-type cytochrome c oxidase subunit I [Nguyenibacter]NVN12018.1 cbb3-type cytochrome c oxidase subunit I [Nguyenibacter vanlangensis]WRH88903.1 cbb3-type cytochrome c oxidase subunit I [Nguyenibacter sp. L1]